MAKFESFKELGEKLRSNPKVLNDTLLDHQKQLLNHKEVIFGALKRLVDEKKSQNPDFNFTRKEFDILIRKNMDLFPDGINSGASILGYWENEFNYLKEKLGLQTTNRGKIVREF